MLASLVSSTASAAPPAATIAQLRYVKSSLPCVRRKGSGGERWGEEGERENQDLAGDYGEKGKDQRGERLHNGNIQRIL